MPSISAMIYLEQRRIEQAAAAPLNLNLNLNLRRRVRVCDRLGLVWRRRTEVRSAADRFATRCPICVAMRCQTLPCTKLVSPHRRRVQRPSRRQCAAEMKLSPRISFNRYIEKGFSNLNILILKRLFLHNICQAMTKLYAIAIENTWNHQPIITITDFLKLLLTIDGDGVVDSRLQDILLAPSHGFASVVISEL